MPNMIRLYTLSLLILLPAVSDLKAEDKHPERDFTLKVLPLLTAKCFGCHGDDPEDVQGALDVRSLDGLLTGGESEEPAIVAGDPDSSPLIHAVMWESYEMPPKENDRLTDEQIDVLRRWIAAGAPWPNEAAQKKHRESERSVKMTADGIIVDTSGGLSDEWTYRRYQPEDLWAFSPVNPPAKSNSKSSSDSTSNRIDDFIAARLDSAGASAAPAADPLTLIRRATFDLIGLPPTPEEIEAFEVDWNRDKEQAWTRLIDRLLESPHYGERWGQHWLDIARYADTAGYSNDYERSNMWRYRDYVVRSFNNDKPYNDFVIEQLAGDELWEQQPDRQRDPELLVATGFLRMGPWDPAMVKTPQARQIYLDDVVNAVGQTFLSTTLRCVKCHDHKFDPIPTRDYYRIYAAFASTQMAERPAPFLPEENTDRFDAGRDLVQKLLTFASDQKQKLYDKRENAARKWFREHDLEYVPAAERKSLPDDVKPPRHVGLDYVDEGQLKVREQDEWIWTRRLERYEPMVQSVYNGPIPKSLNARKLRVPKQIDKNVQLVSHIYTGGSLEALGEEVKPGVMSALGIPVEATADDPYVIGNELSGRRLALAQWIADPRNSLTSRSIVNRIWQHHFGKPLAGNPNNFGAKGAKPTHPELLDWLAADFIEHGWTIKRMHRMIMSSQTYRQAGRHPQLESLLNADPNNDLLAYFPTRRLTAEEMRDAMLMVTGELNTTVGGLPAMPEINMEVALQPRMIQFSLAPAYQPSRTPEERNRRSIYAYRVRGQADPFLEVFNQPNPNESCEVRDAAAVSPQAFTLMNSELMSDRAIAFARRLESRTDAVSEQVRQAFSLAFGRTATNEETERMAKYVERMQTYHQGSQPQPPQYPTRITRSLVEEFSGKPFEYDEILPVFENYTADEKASDVEADTRALADLCLMLFNSNEFLYIY